MVSRILSVEDAESVWAISDVHNAHRSTVNFLALMVVCGALGLIEVR